MLAFPDRCTSFRTACVSSTICFEPLLLDVLRTRPNRPQKRSETSSTHLPAHRLKTSSFSLSLSPFSSFFFRFFLFFLQSWGSLRTKRGLKPLWNTPLLTIYNALSLLSLFLSLSLSLSRLLFVSIFHLPLSLSLSLSLFPSSSLCLSLSTLSLSFFISQSWGYPKNKPKRGLKPLWNTVLLTISGLLLHVFRTALAALSLSIYLFIYLSAPFSLDGLFTTLVSYFYQLEILIFKI